MGRRRFPVRTGAGRLGVWITLILALVAAWQAYHAPVTPARLPQDTRQPGSGFPEGRSGVVVERVVDGDTLVLETGTRVRLLGVDTPETKHPQKGVEPFGPEASEFTRRHVEGARVRLEFDKEREDRYGRLLAYVYKGDWFLNEELIRAGLSRAQLQYPYSDVMKKRFRAAEAEARQSRRGLWMSPAGTTGGRPEKTARNPR